MANYEVPGQHIYKGIPMAGVMPADVLDRIPNFEFKHDDVLITTYPKAGTTWLQQILWLILNDVDLDSSRKVPMKDRSPFMEMASMGNRSGLDQSRELQSPRLLKTHLPYSFFKESIENPEEPKFKIIVGMRNVRDVLVSFFHFYRMNKFLGNFDKDFSEFFKLFQERKLVLGDYFDHVLSWWKQRHNPNIYFVKYEDMKRDPKGEFEKIAAFLGKSLTAQQLDTIIQESSFQSMQSNPMINGEGAPVFNFQISKFIRKGEVGDWQNYFTDNQLKFVKDRCEKELDPVGLIFDYTLE